MRSYYIMASDTEAPVVNKNKRHRKEKRELESIKLVTYVAEMSANQPGTRMTLTSECSILLGCFSHLSGIV